MVPQLPGLGTYRFVKFLGEGAMASVWLAEDTAGRIPGQVACKVLHPDFSQQKDLLARFQQEYQILSTLRHTNIVGCLELIVEDPYIALVLEFVQGTTVDSRLAQGQRYTLDEARDIILQALEGLQFAHDRGVVHRDIKPENLMVSLWGTTKITDFGISKLVGKSTGTVQGDILGTLLYMSPEQILSPRDVDLRTDIYSMALTLQEMLTGVSPFEGMLEREMIVAKKGNRIRPLDSYVQDDPRIPGVSRVLSKAYHADARLRTQSARQLAYELRDMAPTFPNVKPDPAPAPNLTSPNVKPDPAPAPNLTSPNVKPDPAPAPVPPPPRPAPKPPGLFDWLFGNETILRLRPAPGSRIVAGSFDDLRPQINVGRDPDCEIVLASDAVSRRHAQIFRTKKRMYICDAGSTNGTFVNHHQLPANESRWLYKGDIITFGQWGSLYLEVYKDRKPDHYNG